ncbi:MAG: dihydrofolate reductase [Oscillospiraceae bacterium]|nr:dihydrofolate reductase [Oscillospiraceae bacterium]
MELNLIAAVTKDWGIGANGGMLCSLPEDMAFFRTMTAGAIVIMGRATLEALPDARPLKGRNNIVLSRNPEYTCAGACVVHSAAQALRAAADIAVERIAAGESMPQVYVIGGGQVYRQLLPYCTGAWITRMELQMPAESFCPDLDAEPGWQLTHTGESLVSTKEGVPFRICRYTNTQPLAAL